jgi:hypothetical protein
MPWLVVYASMIFPLLLVVVMLMDWLKKPS